MKRSIKRDFQYLSITTIVISMFLLSGFWISYDYRNLQLESERIRTKHMAEYKDLLQYQVDRVVTDIKFEQSLTERHLKSYLKERTEEACTIVRSIISRNTGAIDDTNLRKQVKESLRNIRFNNGSGYYFVINTNGTVELNPIQPELEGHDLRAQQNDRGQFVVADILKIVKSSGEGFYQYTWSKPDKPGAAYPKIAFIKYIPELDWVIGTGEYLDDFTAELQEEIVRRIEQVRFGKDKKDYVFAGTWDGISKTFPAKEVNVLDIKDANGVFLVKELIKKAKAGGGFIQYVMPTLGGVQSKPKLSYAAPIPEWEWYVGAGVYIDEIEKTIANNQLIFKSKVVNHIETMLLVLVCLLFVHFLIAQLISRSIWKQIDKFSQFFRRASTESVVMESDILAYKEFREISDLANNMLKERNAILQEIRMSRDEWINTFNAIGDCVMLIDEKGNILRANETAGKLHGMAVDKLITMAFSDLIGHDNPVNSSLKDQLSHTAEIENTKLNRIFLASSFPIFSPDGTMERIVHIAHDITDRRKLEKQLIQSYKMEAIGTLAGGIAHDFNNILGAILGYAEIAREDCLSGTVNTRDIDQVILAGQRAKELVKQILAFSRQAETEKIPVRLSSIVKESIKLLRSSIPTTIDIQYDIDSETSLVLADPTQIHQVVMNICTNAYHAMEDDGGTLSLSVKNKVIPLKETGNDADVKPGQFVQLSVKDTGSGIAKEIQEKIFDPYFTTKEAGKGTGMGLAIAHGIVKSCGGFITCRSEFGVGTVFEINLPAQPEQIVPEKIEKNEIPVGTEQILFIDDDEILAKMGQTMLERLGYKVTVQMSSIDALTTFKAQPENFDMVITDQTMPGMTGIDLARRMLQIRPDLPILLCTGYSSQVSEEKVKACGIKGFAMKPLARKDIALLIRKVLDEVIKR
jgi:two-component system, cell cycle sensor histidine kinase and response regulator CckA